MMVEDGFDNRSAFIRRLIRQEWQRRHGRSHSFNEPKPEKIEEAVK
jgi:metal-responsive CopG/Arc/MetJ family transcriptional regulator